MTSSPPGASLTRRTAQSSWWATPTAEQLSPKPAMTRRLRDSSISRRSLQTMSTLNQQPLTALVTGATSGLGKEIALRLARDGVHVIVVGRDADRGAAVIDRIEKAGGQARFIAADLSDTADITQLTQEVGDIDVMVNNAGRSVWAPTEDMDVADFDSMLASNVRAPFLLVASFAPAMSRRGSGSNFNVSTLKR